MGVKHNYTASSGDLITSPRWNADHLVSEGVTISSITFVASPVTAYEITCTLADTWYPAARAAVEIPGGEYLAGIDYAHLSVHWKSDVLDGIYCRISNIGNTNTIGLTSQAATGGTYYTSGTQISVSWPTSDEVYEVQVKADSAGTKIYLYTVALFCWDNA